MASKEFKSPRYKFSSVAQFLDCYVGRISKVGNAAGSAAKKCFERLCDLMRKYEEIVLGADGSILSWNPQVAVLEGYGEGEIIGQNLNLFVPPRERDGKLIEQMFQKAARAGTAVYYGKLIRRDGTLFTGSIKIIRVRVKGRVAGFVAVCRKLKDKVLETGSQPHLICGAGPVR